MRAEFLLPLKVVCPRKRVKDKTYWLNFNTYIHLHHMVKGEIKERFQPIEKPEFFRAEYMRITYYVYPEKLKNGSVSKKIFDTRNYTDIVNKMFCDWLVKNNYIEDDNYHYVSNGGDDTCRSGEYDGVVLAIVDYAEAIKKPEQKKLF